MYDLSPIYDLALGTRYQPSGRGRRLEYVTASALTVGHAGQLQRVIVEL